MNLILSPASSGGQGFTSCGIMSQIPFQGLWTKHLFGMSVLLPLSTCAEDLTFSPTEAVWTFVYP